MFPVMGDPVAAGYVKSLARPGGNVTGFKRQNGEFEGGPIWASVIYQPLGGRMALASSNPPSSGFPALLNLPDRASGQRRKHPGGAGEYR